MGCARLGDGWAHGDGVVPCTVCGQWAEYECEYPMGKGETCDAPLCGDHAIVQGLRRNRIDFCPAHHAIANGPTEPIPRLTSSQWDKILAKADEARRKAFRDCQLNPKRFGPKPYEGTSEHGIDIAMRMAERVKYDIELSGGEE